MFKHSRPVWITWPASGLWCGWVVALLLLAEAARAASSPQQTIVGSSRALHVVPEVSSLPSHASRAQQAESRARWTSQVHVEEASFLKLHFVDVRLRPGDVLTVRSVHGEVIEELTGRGPKQAGSFWGLSAFGNTVILEFTYAQPYPEPPFRIDQVLVGTLSPFAAPPEAVPESICGSQGEFEDTVCYQHDPATWANAQAAMGIMTVGGDPSSPDANVGLWCSGVNISPENRILTNQHCIPDQAACDNAEFVFNYRRTACGTGAAITAWKSYRCDAVLVASPFLRCDADPQGLDFSLQSVLGDPAATFGFARPEPSPVTSGEPVYIPQHPAGRPQEITHGGGSNFVVDGNTLRYYGPLDTEGGSSGAPIFREADGALVGLHHCGGCELDGYGNRGVRMADMYPLIEPFLCTTTPNLVLEDFVDLEEVHGNDDQTIDPGETWQLTPRLRNTACHDSVSNVTAQVGVNAGTSVPVSLGHTHVSFGTVPAGQTVSATTPVRFQVDPAGACDGQVVLDLVQITAANGLSFPDAPQVITAGVGGRAVTTLLFEDFANGIPATWQVIDRGTGTAHATWTTTNPGRRSIGLTAPFAIVDAALNRQQTLDTWLLSPRVNTTGFPRVTLQFSHVLDWYHLGQNEQADVEVRSTATQGVWVNVARLTPGDASGLKRFDISAQAAGQTDVQVRFRYSNATFERWWAVDDIFLLADRGPVCQPFDGWEPLFADGFESGNTAAWSGQRANQPAALTVTPTAAMVGSQGLQISIADTRPVYVQDDSPTAESHYRARFRFDPNAIQMRNRTQLQIMTLFNAQHSKGPRIATVILRRQDGQYFLGAQAHHDDGSWARAGFFPLAEGAHTIGIDWARASSPAAHDGWMKLWIDEVLVDTVENLDNDGRAVDYVRLGVTSSPLNGTLGTMYFDHFESSRQLAPTP